MGEPSTPLLSQNRPCPFFNLQFLRRSVMFNSTLTQNRFRTRLFHLFTLAIESLKKKPLTLSAKSALAILLLSFSTGSVSAEVESDPLIGINRGIHGFNQIFDKLILRPVASAYNTAVPKIIKRGIGNFFSNVDDVQVTLNNTLQLDFQDALHDVSRIALNSTIGIGGFIDVASQVGLEKHNEDFGKTLASWGVNSGPYVVLPFFGPNTVRDSFTLGFDAAVNPIPNMSHVSSRNALIWTSAIHTRTQLLPFDSLVIGDSYLFYRDAYLQWRDYQLGNDTLAARNSDF